MRRFILGALFSLFCLCLACCSLDNGDGVEFPREKRILQLSVTGWEGTVVDEKLIDYAKSLDLFLFREMGIYHFLGWPICCIP